MKRCIILLTLLCLLLPATTFAQGQVPNPPTVIDLSLSDVSNDIKLAISSILQQLRGIEAPLEGVTIDPAGRHKVGDGFDFDGYDAKGIAITGYTSTMMGDSQASVILEGIILFRDILSRRAGMYFCVQYVADRNGISIKKSVATGIPPDFPRVETYLIEEDKLRNGMANLTSFADYYLHVLEHAEPMTYGPDGDSTGDKEKYFIVTFCKDRLFQESELKMKVMSKKRQRGNVLAQPVYLNDSGWRFMIAGGKFRPGSRSSKFYITVLYNQEPQGYLPNVVVGEFENVKEELEQPIVPVIPQAAAAQPAQQATPVPVPRPTAKPAPVPVPKPTPAPKPAPVPVPKPAPVPVPKPAPAKVAPAPVHDGPLALGTSFLNPIFPEDVELIQKRLQKLGYYKGPIDMEFGPLTKKGLDRYAVRNGFPPGQWSLDLQKALFKGTGL